MQGKKEAVVKAIEEGETSGSIADMAELTLRSQEELASLKIIYPGMAQREVLNAFRDLRTKLLQRSQGKNFVLMVSSLAVGGGSSFVAMNMAASFALDEQKTAIYIDCNFERSFANQLLGENRDYGLLDYLANPNLEVKDIIYSAGIQRVRIIPPGSGIETAVESLASHRMVQLINALKERYPDRFVVLDVPPVSESSVARILSKVADLSILVVPFGKVTTNQVLSGVDAVSEKKFAGVVFNN